MAISSLIRKIQNLLFSWLYFSLIAAPPYSFSLNFNFDFTKGEGNYSNFINCTGDALQPHSNRCQDLSSFGLTNNTLAGGIDSSVGKAFYSNPVLLRDNATGEVASFNTTFSFKILNTSQTENLADGIAFFLSPFPPPVIYDGCGALGLLHLPSTIENYCSFQSTPPQQFLTDDMLNQTAMVAVEFDTFKNLWDPSKCHVGIDINNISSDVYEIIPNCNYIGKIMTAQISYNHFTQNLSVHLSGDNDPTVNFNITTTVNLSSILPNEVAIGFSAATGHGNTSLEVHQLYTWSFNSTLVPSTKKRSTVSRGVRDVLIACAAILLLLGTSLYILIRKSLNQKKRDIEMVHDESMDNEFEKGRGPKRFQYNELAAATNDFAENKKLGEGGFGPVYRGVLVDEGTQVAIKRVSKASKQGKKEYISEVKIISQLRHRNLVQLIGWCHDHGELLLVYELMHNGNLDTHLYHKERVLPWSMRHQIALGLGSALLYLHSECHKCVVHRDIKPDNVMLDSSFNAKLGDFGLARLIDHNSVAQTVPAGTVGYMAPEYCNTGQATTESDIYSFGMVLLEIACGRKPWVAQEDENTGILLKWVWHLYENNSILDAIDSKLNGEFEAQEAERLLVVGLWCAHPDYTLRPSIRQAVSVLQFESPLPALPSKMPVMYVNPVDPRNFPLLDSTEVTSDAVVFTRSTGSSATSKVTSNSLDTAWLFKEEETL